MSLSRLTPRPAAPTTAAIPPEVVRRDRRLRLAVALLIVPTAVLVLTRWVATVHPVDFLVYRYAAVAAAHGADLYAANVVGPMLSPAGMPFTYTPFAAALLQPTTLGSWHTAYLVWCVVTTAALAWVVDVVVARHVAVGRGGRRALWCAGALVLASASTLMINEIEFGQVNCLLLALCIGDLLLARAPGRARPAAGVLIGVATAVKLTAGLFIVYFLVTRQWRLARTSTLATLGCFLLGATFAPTMSWHFVTSAVWHLSDRVAFMGGFATYGNNSVQGILAALGVSSSAVLTAASAATAVVGLVAARLCHRTGQELEAWLTVGITAQWVSPVSWIHHWVWLVPGVLLVALRARGVVLRLATAGAVALLLVGPGAGDDLLRRHGWPLVPLGVLERECLVVVGVFVVATFAWSARTADLDVARRRLS